MPYDRNDPRRLIELEIIQAMQEEQIEHLIGNAVESEADFRAEIAELKTMVSRLATTVESLSFGVSPAKTRDDLANMVREARELIQETEEQL